jgi:hypothetical protein
MVLDDAARTSGERKRHPGRATAPAGQAKAEGEGRRIPCWNDTQGNAVIKPLNQHGAIKETLR